MTKSAQFEATYYGQNFLVRIDYDGTMTILKPVVDLEYHVAFAAMGGEKSNELKFMQEWDKTPIELFGKSMHHGLLFTKQRYLIALDWVEHTMPIYAAQFPDTQQQAMDIIEDARKKLNHSTPFTRGFAERAWKLKNNADIWAGKNKALAAYYAISALFDLLRRDLVGCANATATATSYRADPDNLTPAFNRAYKTERLWQIRRIIDVVNVLEKTKKRKNAPKNWPPLESTP